MATAMATKIDPLASLKNREVELARYGWRKHVGGIPFKVPCFKCKNIINYDIYISRRNLPHCLQCVNRSITLSKRLG